MSFRIRITSQHIITYPPNRAVATADGWTRYSEMAVVIPVGAIAAAATVVMAVGAESKMTALLRTLLRLFACPHERISFPMTREGRTTVQCHACHKRLAYSWKLMATGERVADVPEPASEWRRPVVWEASVDVRPLGVERA